jgi:hypothetical protein
MENLNETIDSLAAEKLTSLLRENGIRLTKISLRYTTSNKKNSIEYLNEIVGSYEKLLSLLPKGMLNVEKSVRTKFRVMMDEQRRLHVLSNMGREMERILSQMVETCRNEYLKKGQVEIFDKRIEANRSAIKKIEAQVADLMEDLKSAFEETVISPGEISRMYGIEEATLVHMQLIIPLQKMNGVLKSMHENENCRHAVEGIQQSLLTCVKVIKKLERGEEIDFVTPEARKSGKLQIAKAYLRFKDLILNVECFLEQWMLVKENRNAEVIQKSWERIQDIFKGQMDEELIVSKVRMLYELLKI